MAIRDLLSRTCGVAVQVLQYWVSRHVNGGGMADRELSRPWARTNPCTLCPLSKARDNALQTTAYTRRLTDTRTHMHTTDEQRSPQQKAVCHGPAQRHRTATGVNKSKLSELTNYPPQRNCQVVRTHTTHPVGGGIVKRPGNNQNNLKTPTTGRR